MYTSKAEIAEKILTASFREKFLFSCNHISFSKSRCDCKYTGLLKRKDGALGVSKLSQIDLAFPNIRLVIGVSINIFLVFLFFPVFLFFCIVFNIVTELNVSEFNQMCEILVLVTHH